MTDAVSIIEMYAGEQIHNLRQHVGENAVGLARFIVDHDIAVALKKAGRTHILDKYPWVEQGERFSFDGNLFGDPTLVRMEAVVEFRHRTVFSLRGV